MEGGNPVEIEVYTVKQKLFSQNFLVDPIQMAVNWIQQAANNSNYHDRITSAN